MIESQDDHPEITAARNSMTPAERDVRLLGRRIGFGRMMQLAEIEWRAYLVERGGPPGGESTPGPCRGALDRLGFRGSSDLVDAYERQAKQLRKLRKKLRKLKKRHPRGET